MMMKFLILGMIAFLIARKQYGVNSNLEKRMDSLENKLDLILKKLMNSLLLVD